MQKAVFPQRSCREHVPYAIGVGDEAIPMVALCELPDEHNGPCAAYASSHSVNVRERWEAEHGETQAPVETTIWAEPAISEQKKAPAKKAPTKKAPAKARAKAKK